MSIRSIQPWWIRVLVLALIGVPLFYYGPIEFIGGAPGTFPFFAVWILFGAVVYFMIVVSFGLDQLINWVSIASVIAVLTLIATAVVFEVRSGVFGPARLPDGSAYDRIALSKDIVRKTLVLLTSLPYLLAFVNAFSAAGVIAWLGTRSTRVTQVAGHIVIALRVLQHISEVLPELVPVWREENPRLLSPRHRDETNRFVIMRLLKLLEWLFEGTFRWAVALLVYAIEPLPTYAHMVDLHTRTNGTPSTGSISRKSAN